MSDIFFTCFGCSQKIKINEDWAGKIGNCPTCNKELIVPFKKKEVVDKAPAIRSNYYKKCQFCKELIFHDAIRCKHCQAVLINKSTEDTGYSGTSILFLFIILLIFMAGNTHVVSYNGDIKIVPRNNFGFSEFFIDVNVIGNMPWFAAKIRYPVACQLLEDKGILETYEARTKRINEEHGLK